MAVERDRTAVVVATLRLAGILLDRADPDEVAVEGQGRPVPDVPVDAVAEQRRFREHVRVRACCAFGPEEVHARVGWEARVERDPEQSPLRAEVDGEVEDSALLRTVDDPLDAARVLFDREDVVPADEGDARRRDEAGGHSSDAQPRVHHRRSRLLGRSRCSRAEDEQRTESGKHRGPDAIRRHSHRIPPFVRVWTSSRRYEGTADPDCRSASV